MKTIFDLHEALYQARANNDKAFGVFYQSQSNLSNRHYVVLQSEQELDNLKALYKDWDYKFQVIK